MAMPDTMPEPGNDAEAPAPESSPAPENAPASTPESASPPPWSPAEDLASTTPHHFDELHGNVAGPSAAAQENHDTSATAPLTPHWQAFFDHLGPHVQPADLDRRQASLQRQIRDNGITYNLYADAEQPQRPWALDLFPLILSPQDWQQIEAGVAQRVRVLDRLMADAYGEQRLLKRGWVPPALVYGHPGYLPAVHGMLPTEATHLHIAAFDLARGPDGNWWVIGQRTQAPSGLGYLIENRLSISRQFPQAFAGMGVQRLAATYRALIEHLKRSSPAPAGEDPHIALLTPGPFNETYFEHAYLARYLGLTLVEGSDLTVRDQRLYLRTLRGLEPVHVLLKRLDDAFLDPLELRADSQLGVPGLLQAVRAGNLLLANAPGSAFLESPALLGFLPALAQHLLGEELRLPAVPTWWCGERAALDAALPQLDACVIKPTYPAAPGRPSFDAVLGTRLSRHDADAWAGRILRSSDEATLQRYLPLSHMPTWADAPALGAASNAARIVPRAAMLRVFAVADGPQSWRVLPGGLTRIVSPTQPFASMQRGGSSADTWVLTDRAAGQLVDRTTLLPARLTPEMIGASHRRVTSRAAENLFWLGRYTERAENATRLTRLTLQCLDGENQDTPPLLQWLHALCRQHDLIPAEVPPAQHGRRAFEAAVLATLHDPSLTHGLGFCLRAQRLAAFAVRERLSPAHWNQIQRVEQQFQQQCSDPRHPDTRLADRSGDSALRLLDATSMQLAALTGAQTDRMTRDDGWRLLSIGRHIERLDFLAGALEQALNNGTTHTEGGFDAVLALFDSSITFRARYQQSHDLVALLDLLVLDRDNPRALAWVAHTLRGRLAKLAGAAPTEMGGLAPQVPDLDATALRELCQGQDATPTLLALLRSCQLQARQVSDAVSAVYFTHSTPVLRTGVA